MLVYGILIFDAENSKVLLKLNVIFINVYNLLKRLQKHNYKEIEVTKQKANTVHDISPPLSVLCMYLLRYKPAM